MIHCYCYLTNAIGNLVRFVATNVKIQRVRGGGEGVMGLDTVFATNILHIVRLYVCSTTAKTEVTHYNGIFPDANCSSCTIHCVLWLDDVILFKSKL